MNQLSLNPVDCAKFVKIDQFRIQILTYQKQGIAKVVDYLAATLFAVVCLIPVTWVALAGIRYYSYLQNAGWKEQLAARQQDALVKGLEHVRPTLTSPKNRFDRSVCRLDRVIHQDKGFSSRSEQMDRVREHMHFLISKPGFLKNCKTSNDPFIDYVLLAAHTLTVQAEGMREMRKIGKEALKDLPTDPTLKETVAQMDRLFYQDQLFGHSSLLGKVFWVATHPILAMGSLMSHSSLSALEYDAFAMGNFNMRIGTFRCGKTPIHFFLGPTPVSDNLFQGHLAYLEKHSSRSRHIQQTLEHPGRNGEALRRQKLYEWEKDFSSHLRLFSTPLDGPVWKGKGEFGRPLSARQFHDQLARFIKGDDQDHTKMQTDPNEDNGFYLPSSLFPDTTLDSLLQKAPALFETVEGSNHWQALSSESPRRLNKAMLLCYEALIAIQALYTTAGEVDGTADCYLGQACKQDIDRGVLLNTLMLLFADGLSNRPFNLSRAQEIAGILRGRAWLVDDRKILLDRYEALSDLLHLISESPEAFFEALRGVFARELSSIGPLSFSADL